MFLFQIPQILFLFICSNLNKPSAEEFIVRVSATLVFLVSGTRERCLSILSHQDFFVLVIKINNDFLCVF